MVIPAAFPRAVTGVADADLGSHLALTQLALLAPLQRLCLGPRTLLLREMGWPLDGTPAGCHPFTVYEPPLVR